MKTHRKHLMSASQSPRMGEGNAFTARLEYSLTLYSGGPWAV